MKKKKIVERTENRPLLIIKMAAGSALSWEIAKLAGSHHPYLAPLSVILGLQSTVDQTVRLSVNRFIGTIIGILVTVPIASHVSINGWILGLLILCGAFIALWLNVNRLVLHQIALTILFVFVFEQKTKHYAFDRMRDTLIGLGVAVLLHMLLFPPNFTKKAEQTLSEFSRLLSEGFINIAGRLESNAEKEEWKMEAEQKNLLQELHNAREMINKASQSLKLNPMASNSREKLSVCKERMKQLSNGYSIFIQITPLLRNWALSDKMTAAERTAWARQMNVLARFYHIDSITEAPEKEGGNDQFIIVPTPGELESGNYNSALYYILSMNT
ncbi:FUSC family protein [Bacillus sp. FJAT-27251]|uniref:FUSC family protein n=1 Tax=Bacillus sp. FJAT-27251 TaxID=1684142 RepID=UPI0006A7D3BA|nr:FUSC family protein [Bacillus sp. FJAT-27251]